jgi:hypothetical protein
LSNATNWEYIVGVVRLTEGFFPLGIKEYGGVLYIISGKLPTIPYDDSSITKFDDSTQYNSNDIVFTQRDITDTKGKVFYQRKNIIGTDYTPELPIETNKH